MTIRWTRAHEAKRQEIIELLHREVRPFEDMTEETIAARKAQPLLPWIATYLPHYARAPFAPFHYRMVEAVGEAGMPTFVCVFRGAGKSVLLSIGRPLYRTLRREVPYWLYGSRAQKLAAQHMDAVRIELQHNERLRADYGNLTVEGSEEEWVLTMPRPSKQDKGGRWAVQLRNAKFEAFGIGMSPRGRLFHEHRPYEFIGDDLEDAQLARSPERESNLWHWLMDEVMPALEPQEWRMTMLATMFGPDCMVERAKAKAKQLDASGQPVARVFRQPALDEEGRSVWPERFPDVALDRVRAIQGLRDWIRNYALTADDPDKPFQPQWFAQAYEGRRTDLDVVCFLDPAISLAPTGCPRALVAVGADRDGRRHVLDAWIERGTPEAMIDKLFEFHARWQPRLIGIEQNGGYALIRPLLAVWEGTKRYRLPVRYVDHKEAKDLRITRLCPEMESGRWLWPARPSAGVQVLQQQFMSYPDGFVDGPDAAAGCCEFLPSAWGGGRKPGEKPYKTVVQRRALAGVL